MVTNVSKFAAWWGAAIATIVLIWDIYKWRRTSRVLLNIHISTNMQVIAGGRIQNQHGKLVCVTVSNRGDKATTISHLIVYSYKSLFDRIRNKPAMTAVVPVPGLGQNLPFTLEPGKQWTGSLSQNDELENEGHKNRLYCGIIHSADNRPALKRVIFRTTVPSSGVTASR